MSEWINVYADFETFWGTKYSLRSNELSYTDYIFHEKFQVHGVSVIVAEQQPQFLSDRIRDNEVEDFFDWLKRQQDEGYKIRLICHNMLFDGAIARIKYDFVADEYFCTLAMVDALYQKAISSGLDTCMRVLLGWEAGKDSIIPELKDLRTEDIPDELWERLVKYADEDVRACYELYQTYSPILPPQEHIIMDRILKMFCDPKLEFDRKVLLEACEEADLEREQMIADALSYGATEEILKGNKKFPEFLESLGYEVPMKPNPKGKMIPAFAKTDEGFIEMLESDDDRLAALAKGRLGVKSTQAQTRAYRFKAMDDEFGLFMAAYNYARAHTWRVTGGNKVNAANLKRGSKLRTCIVAPDGKVILVCDASQIECRSNGYLAGQEELMQLFMRKEDPYNDMGTDIFGYPVDRKGNPDHFFQGFLGKTATLGLGFKMGGPKFKLTVDRDAKQYLGMDVDFDLNEANRIVYDVYRPKNYMIVEFWKSCDRMLQAMLFNENYTHEYADGTLEVIGAENKIYFPNGTYLYYAGLDMSDGDYTYLNAQHGGGFYAKRIYDGLLCENIVQKFARDITSHHLALISERYPVVMHTYDENIMVVPESEAEEAQQWVLDVMCKPPEWAATIPLDAEAGYAREYSK